MLFKWYKLRGQQPMMLANDDEELIYNRIEIVKRIRIQQLTLRNKIDNAVDKTTREYGNMITQHNKLLHQYKTKMKNLAKPYNCNSRGKHLRVSSTFQAYFKEHVQMIADMTAATIKQDALYIKYYV
jgi:hypothetical protein